jgi:hypothetical protein
LEDNMKKVSAIILILSICLVVGIGQASAIMLPDPVTNAVLYGDVYSYSLPILAYEYDQTYGGGVGPGNPYYVPSTVGAIKDLIVVATGASGGPVNTNFSGMNDAYPTPSGTGGLPYFSTGQTALHPAGPGLTAAQNNNTTWNSTIAAMESFLGTGQTPVFFFNNNQTNSGTALDQQLAVWAQIKVVDSDTGAPPLIFTLENNCPTGNLCISGGTLFPGPGDGGIVSGPDKNPALFSEGAATDTYPVGATGTIPSVSNPNDFVLSGGQVCLNASGVIVNCSDPSAVETINHNLGANQAAYAAISTELDDFLSSWDSSSPYDVLQLDVRMGCNPAYYPGGVCPPGLELNNGYEQIFIAPGYTVPGPNPPPIPEPSTFLLFGAGLLGLGLFGRKRNKKNN